MNVSLVLPEPPLLEGGATGRCAVALLRGLQLHQVSVTALAATSAHSPRNGEPPGDLPIDVVSFQPQNGWRSRTDLLVRPCGQLSRGAFGREVRRLATGADVLHLEQVDTAWCDIGIDVPSVVHIHYLVRRDRRVQVHRRHELGALIVRYLGERSAARRHRFLVANSPDVASALRRLAPHAEVVVVPLSLEPSHYALAPLDGPPTAALIGTAAWPPTAAATVRLVTRVWPLVRRRLPEARLVVAGRGMDRVGLASADEGVDVLGPVPSAADFLSAASLLLYPLERGSGTKVKVLEALASGVPVVTTRSGAEGIDGGDGIVVENSDEQLAAAAVAVLTDELERRQRGAAARAAFLERHTPRAAAAPLVGLYERMTSAR